VADPVSTGRGKMADPVVCGHSGCNRVIVVDRLDPFFDPSQLCANGKLKKFCPVCRKSSQGQNERRRRQRENSLEAIARVLEQGHLVAAPPPGTPQSSGNDVNVLGNIVPQRPVSPVSDLSRQEEEDPASFSPPDSPSASDPRRSPSASPTDRVPPQSSSQSPAASRGSTIPVLCGGISSLRLYPSQVSAPAPPLQVAIPAAAFPTRPSQQAVSFGMFQMVFSLLAAVPCLFLSCAFLTLSLCALPSPRAPRSSLCVLN